jgi:hypothetical protein
MAMEDKGGEEKGEGTEEVGRWSDRTETRMEDERKKKGKEELKHANRNRGGIKSEAEVKRERNQTGEGVEVKKVHSQVSDKGTSDKRTSGQGERYNFYCTEKLKSGRDRLSSASSSSKRLCF